MEEVDYVETSDQDELEESRALFYQSGAIRRGVESPRSTKRRKIFHVYDNNSEVLGQTLQSSHSPGPRKPPSPFEPASKALFSGFKSQSPETDSTEPLSLFFEAMTDSSAETPLSFPPSEDENDQSKHANKDGLDDWAMSQDPLDLLIREQSPLPSSSANQTLSSSQHLAEDDLLDFHDHRGSSPVHARLSSPPPTNHSPIADPHSSRSLFTPTASPHLTISLSPSPHPPPGAQGTNSDAELARALHNDEAAGSRRGLRERREHQLHPYRYDQLVYMQQFKNAPEALVTTRHLEKERRADREQRRRDGYLCEDESQEQEYRPPSDLEEESQMPQQRIRHDVTSGVGDELLPSMSESSGEEMKDIRKEARHIEKEQRRKKKEAERAAKKRESEDRREKDRKNRSRSFPMRVKERDTSRDRMRNQRNATPGPSNHRHARTPSPTPDPGPSSGIRQQLSARPNEDEDIEISLLNDWKSGSPFPADTHDADQVQSHNGHFDYGDDIAPSFGPASDFPPASSSRSQSRPASQAIADPVPGDYFDDYSSSDSVDAKEYRQLKTLGRMYPRFMLPALGVKSGTRSSVQHVERHNQRQASHHQNSTDDEDDYGLRPGLARVRVRKGSFGPIKGDTESEDEDTEMVHLAPTPRPHSLRSPSPSGSHNWQDVHIRRSARNKPQRQIAFSQVQEQEVIEIFSSSEDSSSSDENEIYDEEIANFLQRSANPGRSVSNHPRNLMRNERLIDYMLARTVYIGGSSSRKRGKLKHQSKATGSSLGSGLYNNMNNSLSNPTLEKPTHKHSSSPAGFRHGIVRPRHEGGRQSLLSFENHRQNRDSSRSRVAISSGGEDEEDDNDGESHDSDDLQMRSDEEKSREKSEKKLTWKQKLKQRKEAARMHGIYIHVADPGTRLLGNAGRRDVSEPRHIRNTVRKGRTAKKNVKKQKNAKKTRRWKEFNLYINDEEFQRALAPPTSQHRPHQSALASPSSKTLLSHRRLAKHDDVGTGVVVERYREEISNSIRANTDFTLLPPGQTFGFNTYIRRGMLYELLQQIHQTPSAPADSIATSASDLISHASYKAPRLSLLISLSKPLSDFLRDLPILCQNLGDFITGLPDVDEEVIAREWKSVMRGAHEVLTGLMKSDREVTMKKLQDTVEKAIGSLLAQMRTADFIKSTIDMMTLDVCWFVVELLLRTGYRLPTSNLLLDVCKLLVQYLLEVDPGLRDVMMLIREQDPPQTELNDITSIVQREAELWVCLIHVLRPSVTDGPIRPHPLWDIVGKELERRSSAVAIWTLQANEAIWQTIVGLCALSQFSEHGLCKDKPSLPESWKLISFGLKNVQLKADPDTDQRLNSASLRMKDRYFGFLVRRCFFLVDRWNWAVESSFPVLNVISGAFGTRKFRNLLHEKADFPEFLRTQRWDLCFEYSKRDSAFVLFVKLVVQRGILLKQSEKPSPHSLEKNLTLITPLSSVKAFSKTNPPQGNELSMLYNRMAATAVRLHLSPLDYLSRVQQARQYFNFRTSDDTSRMACIRSLMYVTQMMILEKLPVRETEVKAWYIEIIEVLIKEYKELSGKEENSLNRVRLLLNAVLGSLRHILNAYNDPAMEAQYPDLSLLDVVQKIGKEGSVTVIDNVYTATELAVVIRTFLSLRDTVVPPPERPAIELHLDGRVDSHENEESQDYGSVDFDITDPRVQELLDGGAASNEGDVKLSQDIQLKDRTVGESLRPLTWLLYRCLKNMFGEYPKGRCPSLQYMKNVDDWIDTWIHCAGVAIMHSETMTWFSLCLDVRNSWKEIGDIHWRRRIDIRVALNILRSTPMSYAKDNMKDYFLETLFEALVPGKVTVEHDFLSWLFSIDGLRHPLMKNLPVTLPPYPKILTLSKDDFISSREKLLRGIMDNIEQSLHDEENQSRNRIVLGNNAANQTYSDFLAKFFSGLKEMYSIIPEGSKERQDYGLKCKEIGAMTFKHHPRIGTWGRMTIWDAWWQGLN
ncbi:Mus7/MMS22 family-domain-containing protein [Lentinula aciculospora]|uniref:Mus7/MMS22 family-domain-containing protein n=1 Tax=Lentinula aciculospora TaxID=153920 RepID=A0A9W9DJN3_9AGAR|nr:Mus7/MMS22 family-domain-containing protein [Lentinula aciculospora]